MFAGQVRHGPIEIEVTVLRRGRSMSQLARVAAQPGRGRRATKRSRCSAREREGFSFTDRASPDGVRPPMECPSYRDPPPEDFELDRPWFPFWEHVEGRPMIGHPPWEDYEPETSLRAQYYRFDDPPRADDGTWDPLAVVALCDTMPGAVGERLGPRGPRAQWLPPSADFTVHVLGEARCEWILAVNRARHAGDGYASVDMEMWDVERPAPPRRLRHPDDDLQLPEIGTPASAESSAGNPCHTE